MQPRKTGDRKTKTKKRQKLFNRAVFAVTIVVIVVVSVYALSRPNVVELPSYLARCIPTVSTKLVYSSSFQLVIRINGANQTIPNDVGRAGTCLRPIYTASTAGVIHISTDVNRTYTLQDFFLIWGSTYESTYATFDSNHLFGLSADSSHHVTLTEGNQTDNRYEMYPLPTSGRSDTNPIVTIRYA
ncbi:MAG TPA: hypothetical protein VE177_05515 [Candidatus Binatus sp.]|nr:hypothetical protein [Candidatus Binatus sp.]